MHKEEEKKTSHWELQDPKVPIIHAGPMEDRKAN